MSADGASFSFRGVDFAAYGVYVTSRKWPRLPKPRVNSARYSQRDGGVTQGSTFDRRTIVLECALVQSTRVDRDTNANAAMLALATSQTEGPGDLIVDYFEDYVWTNARMTGGIDSELALAGELFTVEFEADPWPVAATETTETIPVTSGVPVTVTPGGTATVPVIWTLKAGGAGSGVTISNAETGETAVYSNAVASGEWIRLNATTQTWSSSVDSGGTWTNVAANTTGIAPWVTGGVANSVTVTGVSGDLDVEYTAGYRN